MLRCYFHLATKLFPVMRGRHSNIQIQLSAEQQEVLSSWLRRSTIGAGKSETGTRNRVAGAGTDIHAD